MDIFLSLDDLRRTEGIIRKSKMLEYFDRTNVFRKAQPFRDTKSKTSPLRHSFQSDFKLITSRKKMINDICQVEEKNGL